MAEATATTPTATPIVRSGFASQPRGGARRGLAAGAATSVTTCTPRPGTREISASVSDILKRESPPCRPAPMTICVACSRRACARISSTKSRPVTRRVSAPSWAASLKVWSRRRTASGVSGWSARSIEMQSQGAFSPDAMRAACRTTFSESWSGPMQTSSRSADCQGSSMAFCLI